jgi:opacity protein-like surface antigen
MDYKMLCSSKINSRYRLLFCFFCVVAFLDPLTFAQENVTNSLNDPLVVKIYPDGTKLIVRWSEIGKAIDHGESHGGSPKIVSYNMSSAEKPAVKANVAGADSEQVGAADNKSEKHLFGGGPTYVPYEPKGFGNEDQSFRPSKIMEERRSDVGTNEDYGPIEGFTFRTGIGISYQGDLSLSGTVDGNREVAEMDFSPGLRFDLTPGWNFNEYIRLELSTAFLYNQAHSLTINGETYYASNNFGFSSTGIYQVPIMPQVTFSLPVCKEVDLFIGGGFGANFVYGMLLGELSDNTFLTDNINSGSSSSWNYAWQISTGIEWTVMPGLDLEFSYKLLSTLNPTIDAWEGANSSQGPTQTFYNSTASVGLAWRF